VQPPEIGRFVVEFRRLLALFAVIVAFAASIGAISAAGRSSTTPGANVSDIWPNSDGSFSDIWPNGDGMTSDIWPNGDLPDVLSIDADL
jgi:hypothetical protein